MVTIFPIKLFKLQAFHKGRFLPLNRSVVVSGKPQYFRNMNGLNFIVL